jgi:hypothetical protein
MRAAAFAVRYKGCAPAHIEFGWILPVLENFDRLPAIVERLAQNRCAALLHPINTFQHYR